MSEFQNFTSLPPADEREFVVFERRSVESSKTAWMAASITAAAMLIAAFVIVFSFEHKKKGHHMQKDKMGATFGRDKPAEKPADKPADKPKADDSATPDKPSGDTPDNSAKPAGDKPAGDKPAKPAGDPK